MIAQESPHHNLITIRWCGEIIFEVFHPMWLRHVVT